MKNTWQSRLLSGILRRGTGECWEWQRSLDSSGYGQIRIDDSKNSRAHRQAWILENGPVPFGLGILHTCDNRKCCNARPLYPGTEAENMKDRDVRGRHIKHTGTSNKMHKVNEQEIKLIRVEKKAGFTLAMLSEAYEICQSQVSDIVNRKAWKHVK